MNISTQRRKSLRNLPVRRQEGEEGIHKRANASKIIHAMRYNGVKSKEVHTTHSEFLGPNWNCLKLHN
jgi:hypothetical protein